MINALLLNQFEFGVSNFSLELKVNIKSVKFESILVIGWLEFKASRFKLKLNFGKAAYC